MDTVKEKQLKEACISLARISSFIVSLIRLKEAIFLLSHEQQEFLGYAFAHYFVDAGYKLHIFWDEPNPKKITTT